MGQPGFTLALLLTLGAHISHALRPEVRRLAEAARRAQGSGHVAQTDSALDRTDTAEALAADLAAHSGDLVQRITALNVVDVSQEQLKREALRQETLTESTVQFVLMAIALFISEGLSYPHAISLARNFAASFDGVTWTDTDLHSDASYHELVLDRTAPLEEMLCIIRHKGQQDCQNEEKRLFQTLLQQVSLLGTALFRDDGRHAAKHHEVEQGLADPKLLELWAESRFRGAKIAVKIGEDTDAIKHIFSDAMAQMRAMSDEELLTYAGMSKVGIAAAYMETSFRVICLHTTESCDDTMTAWIDELAGLAEWGASTSLLQAGVRPAVQLVMKVMGIPERPEEIAAERAAATKADLAQRKLSSH